MESIVIRQQIYYNMLLMERLILPIVGEAGAGKTSLSAYLVHKYASAQVRVSALIEDYAEKSGMVLDGREDYLFVHKKMKEEQGPSIISDSILKTLGKLLVVDGLRVPNDMDRLRNAGAGVVATVIALDCPFDVRLERIQNRSQALPPITREQLIEDDERDAYNPNPEYQNTRAVIDNADYHIDSARPLVEIFRDTDDIIVPLLG